jgi:hypothetical protein
MSKPEEALVAALRQRKILEQLQEGERTWGDLRESTKIDDENVGLPLAELLDLREIWTIQRDHGRVYGIERRTASETRFAPQQRRAGDEHI